jgi:hypothetical protein
MLKVSCRNCFLHSIITAKGEGFRPGYGKRVNWLGIASTFFSPEMDLAFYRDRISTMEDTVDRTILHRDLNGFFASVECLHRPELKDVPMAVCGDVEKRHGKINLRL